MRKVLGFTYNMFEQRPPVGGLAFDLEYLL